MRAIPQDSVSHILTSFFLHTVDEDGDILDSKGNVLGKAERQDEQDPEPEPEPEPEEEVKIDCSSLAGLKVNKGNVHHQP